MSFFICLRRESELHSDGYLARKGRFRAPSGKDEARNKEWQSSKKTSNPPIAMFDWLTTTVQRNGTFLENLLFDAICIFGVLFYLSAKGLNFLFVVMICNAHIDLSLKV